MFKIPEDYSVLVKQFPYYLLIKISSIFAKINKVSNKLHFVILENVSSDIFEWDSVKKYNSDTSLIFF